MSDICVTVTVLVLIVVFFHTLVKDSRYEK